MRFNFDGGEYSIEFLRQHHYVSPVALGGTVVKSRFPYTTVRIVKHTVGQGTTRVKETVRTATVGAFAREEYTHEKGRLYALRLVSKTLDKDFKRAMWLAYMSRPRG